MKRVWEALKGARKIEWILIAAAAAVLLLQACDISAADMRATQTERRLARILRSVDGVGAVDVMVVENDEGRAEGVLVVAAGAENVGVRLRLQYAVESLLGTQPSRIEIIPGGR